MKYFYFVSYAYKKGYNSGFGYMSEIWICSKITTGEHLKLIADYICTTNKYEEVAIINYQLMRVEEDVEQHEDLLVVYENNKPYGIRDKGGFLFTFPKITKYTGQEERYKREIEEQIKLADYLLEALKKR